MEAKRPVPLWKGIAGASVSAFVLLLSALITIVVYYVNKSMEIWLIIFLLVAGIICLLSFAISLVNISEAVAYRRQNETAKANAAPRQKDNSKRIELLRKLLAEGKITIEEYDELKK